MVGAEGTSEVIEMREGETEVENEEEREGREGSTYLEPQRLR